METVVETPPLSGAATASPPPPPRAMPPHLEDSLKLEHPFLCVPLEHLKKTLRAHHRAAEKEISAVLSAISDLSETYSSSEDAVEQLTSLVSRLHCLKRKSEEGSQAENRQFQKCRARLDHLDVVTKENCEHHMDWYSKRFMRILVDYMLRSSCYNSATMLAEICNMEDLVDINVFVDAGKVIEALQNKEVTSALAWCAENKSRLKKSKSKLEFQLRVQEFIELVRAESLLEAIMYARKYLAPWGTTYMKELQHVTAVLAFKGSTECTTYKELFEPKQWDYLVELFKQEFCRLYGMTVEPLLNIYLQVGLSTIKTPFCYEEGCTRDDPISQEGFRKLASPLPFLERQNSQLVCYITKELMDTDNPPLVLPNGYAYSTKALEDMAKKNDGKVICPRTGYVCHFSELVKAFIS